MKKEEIIEDPYKILFEIAEDVKKENNKKDDADG